ncbi:hypothetical protein SEQ01_17860 [Streptococcus equinus]|uniref:hypothetical protein n=1 Tax=Streptococcus equinus TaxID=1335 RepID=UPI0011448DC7|nr:hypothetical protein [Streptococcus equinus]GEB11595.1 hypothetical protein SEQ01_17860 [Streptococcus equinus]
MKKILFVNYVTETFAYLTAETALDIMMTEMEAYEVTDNIARLSNHRTIEYYTDLHEFNSRMKGLKESNYYDMSSMFND